MRDQLRENLIDDILRHDPGAQTGVAEKRVPMVQVPEPVKFSTLKCWGFPTPTGSEIVNDIPLPRQ